MFLNRIALLLPLVFALQACNDDGAAKAKLASDAKFVAPTPNLNSPDNAVKSWWALNDAVDKYVNENCKRQANKVSEDRAARISISFGSTKEFFQKADDCILETYDRTIERASVETDTRAVVMANIKNSTKIPEGASLSNHSKDEVEKGISYKYVLTRDSDKWYVDEVYYYSSTNVILKRDPWQQEYKVDKNKEIYLGVSLQ